VGFDGQHSFISLKKWTICLWSKPCSNQMIFNLLKSFWKSLEHSVPHSQNKCCKNVICLFEELWHNLVALARYNTISTPVLIITSIALDLLIVRLIIIFKAFDKCRWHVDNNFIAFLLTNLITTLSQTYKNLIIALFVGILRKFDMAKKVPFSYVSMKVVCFVL
jgi:hypothetical protein